jgi:uncharacterized sporulation protein YeaH/YhbH (DUF444 family)
VTTDTDALLKTVQQAVRSAMNGEYGKQNALAALDALRSELEQRSSMENGYRIRAHAAEAELERHRAWLRHDYPSVADLRDELERVKAERDRLSEIRLEVADRALVAEARLDKALALLREIAEREVEYRDGIPVTAQHIARAAIAEIEWEAS